MWKKHFPDFSLGSTMGEEATSHKESKYPEFGMPKALPHENSSGGKGKAKIIMTEAQKERIYHIYREDFENFGYAK